MTLKDLEINSESWDAKQKKPLRKAREGDLSSGGTLMHTVVKAWEKEAM